MFFRAYRTILIFLLLCISTTQIYAQKQNAGEACFWRAVDEVKETGDYQTVLTTYISVVDIAAKIGWNKRRIRWKNLEEEKKEFLLQSVRDILQQPRKELFKDVNLDSFEITTEMKRNVYKIWGSYLEKSGKKNYFEMSIYPNDCQVVRFIWNNISLSWYLEQKI